MSAKRSGSRRRVVLVGSLVATSVLAGAQLAPRVARADDEDVPWAGQVDGGAGHGRIGKRKPFAPDTQVRVTGEDIVRRGAGNLAQALEMLPEIATHDSKRGGPRTDLRGARQRSLMVIVDGVVVDEPFYGGFDLSSIPATDIVEIRISLAPASPLDGPGGNGGVIEVVTLGARGKRRVQGRVQASTAPDAAAAVTGRAEVSDSLAVRVSAGGTLGAREYDVIVPDGATVGLDERGRTAHAALRVEQETSRYSVRGDAYGQHRSYLLPPEDSVGAEVSLVTGEDSARLAVGGDLDLAGFVLEGRAYVQAMRRDSLVYGDGTMATLQFDEHVLSTRSGAFVEADRPLFGGATLAVRASFDSDQANVDSTQINQMTGVANDETVSGRASVGELAAGVVWPLGPVVLDAAVGLFLPLSDGATPWPEGKLTATYQPLDLLTFKLIAARKGRVPTVRERFSPTSGNEALGAEMATFGELQAIVRPVPLVTVRTGAYARYLEDLVRIIPTTGVYGNQAAITVIGTESSVAVAEGRPIGGGVAYGYAHATSDVLGADPLDFVPSHRADAWVEGRFRDLAGGWARARYTGEMLDSMVVLDPYVTVDASAWGALGRELRGSLRVSNLLDERYRARAGAYGVGRTFLLSIEGIWE